MATSGIDSATSALILAAMNGGTAFTITTPLRCLWLTAIRTTDTGSDTEVATASGYYLGVGSLVAGSALTFAAAGAGAPSTSNSNVAATVTNMPACTWVGNRIVDSNFTNRSTADFVLNSTTTLTSATAAFVAGDVGAIVTHANLPTNTVILVVVNGTTVTVSQAATASSSSQTVNIRKPNAVQTTFWAALGSSKTVNVGDTVTVPSGSWQTTLG